MMQVSLKRHIIRIETLIGNYRITMARKKLSVKQLESYLQDSDDFEEPKVQLEQYATPPHIAAHLLNTIDLTYDDLDGKLVADLGCGTGRLLIGSLMCGAKMVYGFDIDQDALRCGLSNIDGFFGDDDDGDEEDNSTAYRSCHNFSLIQVDIPSQSCDSFWSPWSEFFDTVIMNPPFGTKQNSGLDMKFLKRAIDICSGKVYSLHKTSTRDFILGKCQQWGTKGRPVTQIRYNLDNTYKFHKKKSVDIDVDLWQIDCSV